MAAMLWFKLHIKGVNHVSGNSVQGAAVYGGQMPNRLLLAANQFCHASI